MTGRKGFIFPRELWCTRSIGLVADTSLLLCVAHARFRARLCCLHTPSSSLVCIPPRTAAQISSSRFSEPVLERSNANQGSISRSIQERASPNNPPSHIPSPPPRPIISRSCRALLPNKEGSSRKRPILGVNLTASGTGRARCARPTHQTTTPLRYATDTVALTSLADGRFDGRIGGCWLID